MSRPTRVIEVVAGIICNAQQEILIAQRPMHFSFGGFWEFPGGKIEVGESPEQALIREFQEEIGITILSAKPFIKTEYNYPDRTISLDVWWVEQFTGKPHGAEEQIIRWTTPEQLSTLKFPAANQIIIQAIQKKFNCC